MTAPFRRRGPRPLPLHLGLAGIRAMAAAGALPGMPWPNGLPPLSGAWPISKAGQAEAARISAALASAGHAPEAFRGAVLNRLLRADRALVAGLAAAYAVLGDKVFTARLALGLALVGAPGRDRAVLAAAEALAASLGIGG